ncbi:AAA family ATPase [Weeksellaceae bacterium TAE3-ERU29]|nr:AAA family ATPase [Weeksellaceae bacterium TAE3-ERU29]
MKILKIAFKNINSLEGNHEIDFTKKPFTENNLFAITGATGSGKSTILDVIALALYNETPRMGKVSKGAMQKSGAILTRGQNEAEASVTYSCKKGIFQSVWSVRVARTGTLQDYEMFLYDAKGSVLNQKKSEVPFLNEEFIGLNYEQFIKSVMLAQGEFAKFLKVNKNERSALLEQITGTDIYRKIGIKAYEKFKDSKTKIDEWEREISKIEEKILNPDLKKTYQTEQEQIQTEIIENQKEIEVLKNQIAHKNTIEIEQKKLENFNKNKSTFEQNLQDFNEKEGIYLSLHKKTESISVQLSKWENTRNQYNKLEKEETELNKTLEDLANKKENLIKEISVFTHEEINQNNLEEKLNIFRQKVNDLEESRKEKLSEYKNLRNQLSLEIKPLNKSISNLSVLKSELINLKSKSNIVLNELKTKLVSFDLKNPQEEILVLRKELETAYTVEKEINEIKTQTKNIEQKTQELNKVKEDLAPVPEQLKTAETIYNLAYEKLNLLKEKFDFQKLKQSFEEHRNHLVNGKPCPLCGALEHPFAKENKVVENALETEIKQQEIKVNKSQKEWNALEKTHEILAKNQANLENEISLLNKELELKKENFNAVYPKEFLTQNWTEKIEKNKQSIAFLEEWKSNYEIHEVAKNALPIIENLQKIEVEGKSLRTKIEELIGDKNVNDEIAVFSKKWTELNTDLKNKTENVSIISEEKSLIAKEFNQIEDDLSQKVKILGFDDIVSAQKARLEYSEVQRLENQHETLKNQLKETTSQLVVIQENYNELLQKDVDSSKAELNESVLQKTERQQELNKKDKEFSILLTNDKSYRKDRKSLKEKIAEETKNNRQWRLLDNMIGDATGNKFNRFAQDLTLKHLLILANKRLEMLTPRYVMAQPSTEEDDSLIAIDKDMGNQRRSVKTLSGGETFILSLALALALSDLASKNVQINSLFIDEGFGTLDPETLDQTLDTLERLQQESDKMIGIISHVDSLKERITTQIALKQNGFGLSTLEIKSI